MLTFFSPHAIVVSVEKIIRLYTEEYPSPAEGIGLENRQAGYTARGFESLFLRHFSLHVHRSCSGFFIFLFLLGRGANRLFSLKVQPVNHIYRSVLFYLYIMSITPHYEGFEEVEMWSAFQKSRIHPALI